MTDKENLEQMEQSTETVSEDDDKKSELKEVLWQEYLKVELSRPDEDVS